MRRVSIWPILGGIVFVAWWVLSGPSGTPASEVVDPGAEPVQEETDREPFRVEEFRVIPRAEYEIAAEVAGVARYRFGPFASIAPVDAVLTWGALPEPPYAGRISYSQVNRYYFWSTRSNELDLRYIARHSANVHLLPASDNLHRALVRLDAGDRVRLRGLLTDVDGPDGTRLRTSTTRTDTGPGACEVFWVEEAQVGATLYR